tara:strand:- start:2402 stop:2575 length:174 start_codon:yes stop_codon:yes gene_type:complete
VPLTYSPNNPALSRKNAHKEVYPKQVNSPNSAEFKKEIIATWQLKIEKEDHASLIEH